MYALSSGTAMAWRRGVVRGGAGWSVVGARPVAHDRMLRREGPGGRAGPC